MYSIEKKSKIVGVLGRYLPMLLVLGSIVIGIQACSKDEVDIKKFPPPITKPPGEGNQGDGQDTIVAPADSLDANVILDHLSLMDAIKVTGEMPVVPNTPDTTAAKDTIYLTKGLGLGYPVPIRHNGMQDITGVFVGLQNGSFYYDMPVVASEARDSTDIFYVNIDDLPIANFQDHPISFPIHLMPHVNGLPIKDHIGVLVIEKSNKEEPTSNNDCPITVPPGSDRVVPPFIWSWQYTYVLDAAGQEVDFQAAWGENIVYDTGGCCNGNFSYPVGSGDCSHYLVNPVTNLIDTSMVNPKWRKLHVSQIYKFWEDVTFFDDGTFDQFGGSYQDNVSIINSDFCNNEVSYYDERHSYPNSGTHDFMPGADYLNITYDPSTVPRKTLQSGEILYSCNTLAITYSKQGDGESLTYIMVFLKLRYIEDEERAIHEQRAYEPPWEIITDNPFDHAI